MDIKKFESFKLNEHQETQNYMFFGNLKTIKRLVDEMLEMDEAEVDNILTNGHNWAVDHISTSKDDVEEVFTLMKNNLLAGHSEEHEEDFKVFHSEEGEEEVEDSYADEVEDSYADEEEDSYADEEEDKIKGFEDFQ